MIATNINRNKDNRKRSTPILGFYVPRKVPKLIGHGPHSENQGSPQILHLKQPHKYCRDHLQSAKEHQSHNKKEFSQYSQLRRCLHTSGLKRTLGKSAFPLLYTQTAPASFSSPAPCLCILQGLPGPVIAPLSLFSAMPFNYLFPYHIKQRPRGWI